MPLPTDEKLIALSDHILKQFGKIFGEHPGFRPAQHFNQASTPGIVRFSDSTGIPLIPDNDPNANPKGIAVRFGLAEHRIKANEKERLMKRAA